MLITSLTRLPKVMQLFHNFRCFRIILTATTVPPVLLGSLLQRVSNATLLLFRTIMDVLLLTQSMVDMAS